MYDQRRAQESLYPMTAIFQVCKNCVGDNAGCGNRREGEVRKEGPD